MTEPRKILFTYEGVSACVELESEITLDQLKQIACDVLDLQFDIDLQIFDNSFNEWVKCLSILSIQNMQRIKIRRRLVDAPVKVFVKEQKHQPGPIQPQPTTSRTPNFYGRNGGNLLIRTFEVPEFDRKVLVKLTDGDHLNRADRTAILDKFYDAIMPYTVYPTPTEYRHIASLFLAKYPNVYAHVGYDLALEQWKSSLVYKFQNTRKNDKTINNLPQVLARRIKKRKLDQSIKMDMDGCDSIRTRKPIWDFVNYLPSRIPGTTDEDVIEHLETLESESLKGMPDYEQIYSAMMATLPLRRSEVIEFGFSVQSIVTKYYFLTEEDEIMLEYSRISGRKEDQNLDEKLMYNLKKLTRPLLKITKLYDIKDFGTKLCVKKFYEQKSAEDLDKYMMTCSLLLLLLMLKEKVSNIFVKEGTVTCENINVFISYRGELEDTPTDFKVHVDHHVIKCSSLARSLAVFLAVHYVFNAHYTKYNAKFIFFIEKYCADIVNFMHIPKSVVHLNTRLIEAEYFEKKNLKIL